MKGETTGEGQRELEREGMGRTVSMVVNGGEGGIALRIGLELLPERLDGLAPERGDKRKEDRRDESEE